MKAGQAWKGVFPGVMVEMEVGVAAHRYRLLIQV
jgi:hypothetical protein